MKPALILATVAVVAMTLVPAIQDGQRRFRWGEDSEVLALASRLDDFPKQIGQWRCTTDELIDKAARNQLEPFTYVNRTYVNDTLQMQTTVFILMGPSGPTAVHTPDICFSSRDFTIWRERQVVPVDPSNTSRSKCFETRFQSRDASGSFLTSWYAWTVDGVWHAPEQARYFFSDKRYLFKIQIATRYADREEMENDKVMGEFLAEIEKALRFKVF